MKLGIRLLIIGALLVALGSGLRIMATFVPDEPRDDGFHEQCIANDGHYWERGGMRGCYTDAPFKSKPV